MRSLFALITTMAVLAGPAYAQPANPNQVAILRWYAANQTAEFTVGMAPQQVAFDGANIGVANTSGTVSKR